MRGKILLAAAFFVLLFCVYFFFSQSPSEKPGPENQRAGEEQQTNAEVSGPQAGAEKTETAGPAGIVPDESATINLSPGSRTYSSQAQAQPEVSYSLEKENKERTIMPGVTYRSGEGINMEMDEDEKILIRRDSTYRSSEVQVMWKKTF